MNAIIFILDDQAQYIRSLERALRDRFHVRFASTVAEAAERFYDDVDLVLADIRLDESNDNDRQGLEFIRLVRSRRADMPIVAMSALDAPDIEAAALSAGATRFLRKPIVVSELRKLLTEVIGTQA